jgi:hypothetical protein
MVLAEHALPHPYCLVTVRTVGPNRMRRHFLPNADEARAFAAGVAEQRGLIMVDMIAADEGGEQ